MNLVENIREGLKSVSSNLLRSILTALIIAIGITSLVGILTAIDGLKSSISDSFSSLGANSFQVRVPRVRGRNAGRDEKRHPPITYKEAVAFANQYGSKVGGEISLSTRLTGAAELKRLSEKTNPNITVMGINEQYIGMKGLDVEFGRNFSALEARSASNLAIIGPEIKEALFKDDEDPLEGEVTVWGTRYRIIGVLSEQGAMDGGSSDRRMLLPLQSARSLAAGRTMRYTIDVGVNDPTKIDFSMGEATGIMRIIRRDRPGQESFVVEKSETLAERLEEVSGYLRMGGFGIGFITLLGASIGLMNIMMVSVTERTREIGVRKALGATPLRIRQQFIIEAIVVCLLGGLLGIVLGIAVGNLFAQILNDGDTPAKFVVPWAWMFMGVTICVVVGLLSGYYPAYKASKLDPIDSLRFE